MAEKPYKAVGIQLMDGSFPRQLKAILRVRPDWDKVNNCPAPWPGGCEITALGKVQQGESFLDALWREIEMKLGSKMVPTIQALHADGKFIELVNCHIPGKKHTIIYGVIVENGADLEKVIQNHLNTFRFISRNQATGIYNLLAMFDKRTGVRDGDITAMSPPDRAVVIRAFKVFG